MDLYVQQNMNMMRIPIKCPIDKTRMIENEKPKKKLTYLRDKELKKKLIIRLDWEPPLRKPYNIKLTKTM